MATVTNSAKLEELLLQQINKAVTQTVKLGHQKLKKEIASSYASAQPTYYYKGTGKRTGMMKDYAPLLVGTGTSGHTVHGSFRMNSNYAYDSGTYSALKVFQEAETGGSGIVMASGWWQRTMDETKKIFERRMKMVGFK